MASNLAQTMLTLAEDNRDIKTALRLMLKYEINSLLDRLSDLGEDSLLLLANTHEGTSTHIGTANASTFLTTCTNNYSLNLKDTFLNFCVSCSGNMAGKCVGGVPDQITNQNDVDIWKDTKLPQLQQQNQASMNQATNVMANLQDLVVKQSRHMSRFSPYHPMNNSNNGNTGQMNNMGNNGNAGQMMNNNPGQINMGNNSNPGQMLNMGNNINPRQMQQQQKTIPPLYNSNFMGGGYQQQNNNSSNMMPSLIPGMNSSSSMNNGVNNMANKGAGDQKGKKRHVCRHFVYKGHCWQGNMCSFLHTKDQAVIDRLGTSTSDRVSGKTGTKEEQETSSSQDNKGEGQTEDKMS